MAAAGPVLPSLSPTTVLVAHDELTVDDFLALCSRSLAVPDDAVDPALLAARDALLRGGLPAVALLSRPLEWIQVDITPASDGAKFYTELHAMAVDLLSRGGALNFFFMHKRPGIRVRFEVTPERRLETVATLRQRLDDWTSSGLIRCATPNVYEPEEHLFGGPASMVHVHRLFTADSIAWLGHHRVAVGASPRVSWAFSLALLRTFFDAMRIVDWEDRDVWNRVRRAGRRLTSSAPVRPHLGELLVGIREMWDRADLSAASADVVEAYGRAVGEACERWIDDYFATEAAYVGPREAAAYYVIFHWNRGRISDFRQAVIAESLAEGGTL